MQPLRPTCDPHLVLTAIGLLLALAVTVWGLLCYHV